MASLLIIKAGLRGRVVKGVGHLDHVWSYGVREVVSSIPDRGNLVGWVFLPTRWLVRFSHLNIPLLQNSELILFRTLSSWGSSNYWPSAPFLYEVASHVKKTAIPAIIIIINVDFHRYDILFKWLGDRNSLELFREWSEKSINCKVLGQTGSLAEFTHGILEKLYGNSRIRRVTT